MKARDAAKHPTVHRTATHPTPCHHTHTLRNYQAQHVSNAEFKTLIKDNFLIFYLPFKKIEVQLIYNVVLASSGTAKWFSYTYMCICIYLFFCRFFPL